MRLSHHHDFEVSLRRRSEDGYVIAMMGLLLIPLLLMVGLSVDVGFWYTRASEVQKAADAAALAGVVFLPNTDDAETHARTAALRNGFDYRDSNVTMEAVPAGERRLRVTITEHRVGSFFFGAVGGRSLDITRSSMAQYVDPVPLGSPRNFFGLGTVLREYGGTGFAPEFLYQSVNPFCTDKVNGDRHQSWFSGNTCNNSSGRTQNAEYREKGYELYIDAVAGRPADIEVRLYDPRYNESSFIYRPPGQTCGATTYTPAAPSWTGPGSGSSSVTITGPAQYQTRNSSTSAWRSTQTIGFGETYSYRRDRIRYRTGVENCTPATRYDLAPDDYRSSGQEQYKFSLFEADTTPFDDTDNPLICERTFAHNESFDGYSYLGTPRWNTLCTIPRGGPSGKYILRVENGGEIISPQGDGSNQWGLVARYTSAGGDGLCDGRNDASCPRVYGKEAISVRAAADTDVASFFLAEIEAAHAGKTLRLELFDPGEGGRTIEIMRPSGVDGNTWVPARFSWSAPGEGSGNNVTSVDVREVTGYSGSTPLYRDRFNGKVLTIDVDLTGYSPPANNEWWQIKYTFAGADVTDRTTWSATVLGDPVHLVEED